MAPEQMRREPLDGRCDQFAWGVVAYELLSGAPPWGPAVDALELVSKILSDGAAPARRSFAPSAPTQRARRSSAARCREATGNERFASMDELLVSSPLVRTRRGEHAPTMPSCPPPARCRRRPPRRRLIARRERNDRSRRRSRRSDGRRRSSRAPSSPTGSPSLALAVWGDARWPGAPRSPATNGSRRGRPRRRRRECTTQHRRASTSERR